MMEWKIVFCAANFCKICKKPIFLEKGFQSPSKRHYYHFMCVGASKAFLRDKNNALVKELEKV